MNQYRVISRQKQGGFTFIELCVALVIIVSAYLAITHWIIPRWDAYKAGNEAKAADTLTQTIKSKAVGGDFGTGSLLDEIYKSYPGQWTMQGTATAPQLLNEYSQSVTVTGNTSTATITLPGETEESCQDIVTEISENYSDATITAGSQSWPQGSPVTAQAAASACSADRQTVSWTVYPGT